MQTEYNENLDPGFEGMIADNAHKDIVSAVPNSRQINTVTIDQAEDELYTVTINGEDFTHTGDSDNATQIAAALVAAINGGAEPVTASSAEGVITLVANEGSVPFTLAVAAAGEGEISMASVQEAGEDLPLGRAVLLDANGTDANVVLPKSAGDVAALLGVSISTQARESKKDDKVPHFAAKESAPIMKRGRVWIKVEDAVTPQSAVYVRHGVDGQKTAIGGFAGAAGTGLAAWTKAKFMSSASAGGLAVLDIVN